MKVFHFLKCGLLLLVIMLGMKVQAQNAHDFYVTAGWLYLAPQSNSSTWRKVAQGNTAINQELPNTAVRLGKANTLGVSGGYFFTDRWAVEFTAGIPPSFDIKGWYALSLFNPIAKTTAWTPILQAKYRLPITSRLKISGAVGATYCWFTNSKIVAPVVNQFPGILTNLTISSAFRPVFSGGVSYSITDNWFVNGNFSAIPLKVVGTLKTENSNTNENGKYKIDVDLNPIMTYLSVGYVFKKHKK